MKRSEILPNPRVLLYGYGKEGQSSKAWVQAQLAPFEVVVFEDREGASKPDWSTFDLIIKSPGVPPSSIPDAHWGKVTSNLRLFLENLTASERKKIIGITGSKGKSTTAKFTHQLLQTAGFKSTIIGNFGVPALEIAETLEDYDYIVAECSSFQLYDLKTSPHYALFLSFFADHLDWHNASEVDYFAAKANLWRYQSAEDFLITPSNLPSAVVSQLEASLGVSQYLLSETVPADFFPQDSNLQASHFRQNLGTVWALAQQLGIKNLNAVWKEAAATFEPIEHRLETVATVKGLTFINDSIATGPEAAIVGVNWLGENLSGLIIDGADLGVGDFDGLIETLTIQAPKVLVALIDSEVGDKFKGGAKSQALNTKAFSDYQAALDWFQAQAKQGTILFSPAGKSFNRFANYSERGRFFKNLVNQLQ